MYLMLDARPPNIVSGQINSLQFCLFLVSTTVLRFSLLVEDFLFPIEEATISILPIYGWMW